MCAICAAGVYCSLHDQPAIDDSYGSVITPEPEAKVIALDARIVGERHEATPEPYGAAYLEAGRVAALKRAVKAIEVSHAHDLDDSYTCTVCHVLDEDALRADLKRLRAQAAEDERALMQVIDERDDRQRVADDLAEAISRLAGVEIGEHSTANDPWANALAAARRLLSVEGKDTNA